MPTYVKAREVKKKKRKDFLAMKNVRGIGIGKKVSKGKVTDEICIRFYVEKKIIDKRLKKEDIIPKEIDGIKTDVFAVGKVRFHDNRDRNT